MSSQHHTSAPDPCVKAKDYILDVEHCDHKQLTIATNIFYIRVTSAFDFYHRVRKLHFTRFLLFDFLAILEVFELRNEVSSIFNILFILCATLLLSNSLFRRQSCFCCSGFPNDAKSRLLVLWRHVAWHYFAENVFSEQLLVFAPDSCGLICILFTCIPFTRN